MKMSQRRGFLANENMQNGISDEAKMESTNILTHQFLQCLLACSIMSAEAKLKAQESVWTTLYAGKKKEKAEFLTWKWTNKWCWFILSWNTVTRVWARERCLFTKDVTTSQWKRSTKLNKTHVGTVNFILLSHLIWRRIHIYLKKKTKREREISMKIRCSDVLCILGVLATFLLLFVKPRHRSVLHIQGTVSTVWIHKSRIGLLFH